jgi:fumarylacetoacetate (FAA) hydrolase
MKLGSLKEGGRDGTLVVVSRDLTKAVRATGIAPTLQRALEDWSNTAPRLNALAESLDAGDADGVFDLDMQALAAPLPRAYEFVDGSAYLPHVARVRKARGAEVPESFYSRSADVPGVSAGFYGPRDPVKVVSEDYGIDLEAEIVDRHRRRADGGHAGTGGIAYPAHRPGQRCLAAQPDPERAGQGFRLPADRSRARR